MPFSALKFAHIATRTGLAFLLATLGALAIFCCAYVVSGYGDCVTWYRSLEPCLYRDAEWTAWLFTPATKATGNWICAGALVTIAALAAGAVRGWTAAQPSSSVETAHAQKTTASFTVPGLFLALAAISLGLWSALRTSPANDEIFSAIYDAAAHPFVALSYYPLPNNHVLFNTLNALLFPSDLDAVWTGRLLSIAAYAVTVCVAGKWFHAVLGRPWAAVGAALVVALQMPLWGFSGQARGYALNALAHWVAFAALHRYGGEPNPRSLRHYALASVVGYATVPTFLYFHTAAAVWMGGRHCLRGKFDTAFWRSHIAGLLGAFLCYVPALCFSGVEAVTGNPYVQPLHTPLVAWITDAMPVFASYDDFMFSGIGQSVVGISSVLAAFPLMLLLVRRDAGARRAGAFVVVAWVCLFAIMVAMRKYPFHRNLIGYFSITAAVAIVAVHHILCGLARRLRRPVLGPIVFGVFCALLGARLTHGALRDTPFMLYFYDSDGYWGRVNTAMDVLPRGAAVSFSDEAFVGRYCWQARGEKVLRCPWQPALYYVATGEDKVLEPSFAARYRLVYDDNGFLIYRRAQ